MPTLIDDGSAAVVVTLDRATVVAIEQAASAVEVSASGPQGPAGEQGPPGEGGAGGGTVVTRTADGAVAQWAVVRSTGAATVATATNADLRHADDILGIALAAAAGGASVQVANEYDITDPAWTWAPQEPVFLGAAGVLTQVVPVAPAAQFLVIVGYAMSATAIRVRIGEPIFYTLTPPSEGGGGSSD